MAVTVGAGSAVTLTAAADRYPATGELPLSIKSVVFVNDQVSAAAGDKCILTDENGVQFVELVASAANVTVDIHDLDVTCRFFTAGTLGHGHVTVYLKDEVDR